MAQYRLDLLVADLPLVWYVRVFLKLLPWRLFITANDTNAARFRLALEALGPVFVKFGQVLSTRRDLLSDAYAIELSKLQDQVPPFDGATAQKIIEQELESPITVLFKTFEQTSLASASVAQVHQATLHTGQEVVVKVIRPGINRVIEEDIALLYLLAWLVSRFWSEGKRLRPLEVVHEYEQTLMDELDLRKEAANGSQLRRNFEQSDILYVPEVYWDYTRQNVLVMERIYGIPVADIQALNAQNTHMQKLAERGVEIFFTQVFRDSFFHADMHPGNIFVSREDPQNPQYIAIDFGIIGSLTEQDQHYLARNILAFFKRDYRQVAQLHIDSGWVPRHTNLHAFETAIRSVCEPIFEKPLKDISFGMVLLGLFQTARRFQMEVQPQLVLLQKTLLNIEGLGRQLYPDLDLWKTAKPFLEDWMKARMSIRHNSAKVLEQLPEWFEKFPQLPHVVFDALQASRQTQEIQMQQSALQFQQLEKRKQRQRRFMLAGVSSIAAVVFMLDSSSVAQWSQLPWIGWLLLVLGWLFIWYA